MRAEMRQLIAEDAKTQQSREHLETELAQVQSSLLANKAAKKDSERQKKSQEALEVRKPLRPLPHAPLDARARRPGDRICRASSPECTAGSSISASPL